MKPWKTLSKTVLLDLGKFLTVENHTIELPNGLVIEDWPWVIAPDYVNIMVETVDGRYLVFMQVKYCVDGTTLAPIGGMIEPGEDPLEAAKRELMEESGYTAPEWISLGSYAGDGNRGVATGHLYLARGAYQVNDPDADDLEEQEPLLITRAELHSALMRGEFKVASWTAVAAMALLYSQDG